MVAHACPWAHRTLIMRALKGLEDVISVAYAVPLMLENGWDFGPEGDSVTGARYAHEVYAMADGNYSGRCSVPILWDRERATIRAIGDWDVRAISALERLAILNNHDALARRESLGGECELHTFRVAIDLRGRQPRARQFDIPRADIRQLKELVKQKTNGSPCK